MSRFMNASCILLLVVLFAGLTTSTTALGNGWLSNVFTDWALRSANMNWYIDNTIKRLYLNQVRFQDDCATKYGNFGPNSVLSPSGPGGMNVDNFAALTAEMTDFLEAVSTPNLTYIDYGYANASLPASFGVGPTQIAENLALVVFYAKVYGQYHTIGEVSVEQLGEHYYCAGGSSDVRGHVYLNATPGAVPSSLAETTSYYYPGERYHCYLRVIDQGNVYFKLDKVRGYGFARILGEPANNLTYTSLGDRYTHNEEVD
jgi:hypothetical protein